MTCLKATRTKALYAGSFDPITCGHFDIAMQAASTFNEVHIAVGRNPRKSGLFSVEERLELIRATIREAFPHEPIEHTQFTVGEFSGSSLDSYAREIGATHIVRGLRQVSDFNDEFVLRGAVEMIDEGYPKLTMAYFICNQRFLHVSSSTARELGQLGKRLDWLVGPAVEAALREKFRAAP